ncbi:hypothetical protein TrVE_jg14200 [Triparma verrucosa]|uniref:6-phosphofructo-2-kinase domain-containing protein n=1 Tax=Triparma verrucosa TaxID=1606542 RepID=A0A9W7BE85_9STRA|nr:hypothetical protein TrVE_jg14200 [Triparma verrucosa]
MSSTTIDHKIVLVLVGLPARGKSYIAHKVLSYFRWQGIRADIFNVGKFRRKIMKDEPKQAAEFFASDNAGGANRREELAMAVLDELIAWSCADKQPSVAIFDATNTTNARRRNVVDRLSSAQLSLYPIFVESICDSEEVLEKNLLQKIRNSPDYADMSELDALVDLKARIKNYENVYEPLEDDSLSYIKLINLRAKVICNLVYGALAHQIVNLLMSTHIQPRPIWLTRPGTVVKAVSPASMEDRRGSGLLFKVTDVAPLDEKGRDYAKKLSAFIRARCPSDVKIHCSTLGRSHETVKDFCAEHDAQVSEVVLWSALNNLDTGICHGMTPAQIKESMPEEFQDFMANPFTYRVPNGESYSDLVKRLDPFVLHMERTTEPMLIVSHMSVLQVLMGYFCDKTWNEIAKARFPPGVVVQLTPSHYGWKEEFFRLEDGDTTGLTPLKGGWAGGSEGRKHYEK